MLGNEGERWQQPVPLLKFYPLIKAREILKGDRCYCILHQVITPGAAVSDGASLLEQIRVGSRK